MPGPYDFKSVESSTREFWEQNRIYEKAKEGNQTPDHKKFYFLDGPPYTSGKAHIGHTWNHALKDVVLRYKRMSGFNVWDRAGYDMHGLPTEHATEKELGIHGREQIEAYGVEKFIDECRKVCIRNMLEMNKVFKSLGVWMDFDNAYQPITKEFIEGEWWFVKTAHEKGRLYEGERTMTWDPTNATALAKHELEYKTITDTAIYVKMRVKDEADTYLIIWTTTPWTIPFNLAIMANPDVTYVKAKVLHDGKQQIWILAKDLMDEFIVDKMGTGYEIIKELKGSDIAGLEYEHPFASKAPIYAELKSRMPKVHTVLMSTEYVDTSTGTGLVHCAPGCGPEDYEVGHRNGIKPFNTLDEQGVLRDLAPFNGLIAKTDDDEFIRLIDEEGALLHTHKYSHEYPHGERSRQPVVFRTTKQWFLKVEDIKDRLIEENNKIAWRPEAAYNAFNSWLENLRDNSISKQRFWGTPIPVWRSTDDPKEYIVVGSAKELAELAGLDKEPEDLHIPTVDKITFKRKGKDGKMHEYRRIPDVLDVWVDAGTTSWNCLFYPGRPDLLKEWYPAAFILEGKDQIRGWFNLLHIASMIAFDKPAFKAVYMHGFINDSQGRKMSKSLGNYILPEEIISKYGVDTTRYYMIGAANPGFDMNYNFDDTDAKFKNMLVYWNMHNYLLELAALGDIKPKPISSLELGLEERYLLSRLNTAIKGMTEAFDEYRLNETPVIVEEFLLDMSRTYIQLVRDKATAGTDEEKETVVSALAHSMLDAMTLFAPIAPYFAEAMYQDLKAAFPEICKEESIHLRQWPTSDGELIDEQLEKDFIIAKDLIGAILAARDKAQLGVRWPASQVRVDCTPVQAEAIRRMETLVKVQTNVKDISFEPVEVEYVIEPNTKTIGKAFGKETQEVMALIARSQEDITQMLRERKSHIMLDQRTIKEEHLDIKRQAPDKYQPGEGNVLRAYLDTTRTPELEREGYAREIIRRIQQLRKTAGLVKSDRIGVEITSADSMLRSAAEEHSASIAERTGSTKLQLVETLTQGLEHTSSEKIKGAAFIVGFSRL
jgi:isoleucyl-tRNA synthetase